ncbi:cytochrome C oxidase subunit II [Gracilibacillus marinus]|jgi:cytochrome c oxidase subunit II|uniref:Cytochrome C oxidase subunit II n=1 Tax=Gracilibacillus marinus TaxID=630535 RepID=A0ABV8VT70_9BACI
MKKIVFVFMALTLTMVLAACGGDDKDSGGDAASGDGETVNIKASNWQFDQEEYTVPAGEVTINLANEDGYHGIDVEGTDISIDSEGNATATLEPGEYTIRCNIPCGTGHEDMVATLIVE